jgi:hypothetical protein
MPLLAVPKVHPVDESGDSCDCYERPKDKNDTLLPFAGGWHLRARIVVAVSVVKRVSRGRSPFAVILDNEVV